MEAVSAFILAVVEGRAVRLQRAGEGAFLPDERVDLAKVASEMGMPYLAVRAGCKKRLAKDLCAKMHGTPPGNGAWLAGDEAATSVTRMRVPLIGVCVFVVQVQQK